MAITGDYNLYNKQIPYNLGTVTQGQQRVVPQGIPQEYSQGVPNTTPSIFGIPSTDDMEKANKIAEMGLTGVQNPFMEQGGNAYKPTGTGELSPVLEGRADEIEDCPWKEYWA